MSDMLRRSEIRCRNCGEEFQVDLEWLSRMEVIIKLIDIRCPSCDSIDWTFTDRMSGVNA